eukprot:m.340697 g.340697  ORF g.340697 m.340697 type:complete len:581 (-) comp19466_c0_seq1:108-1850(-)
MAVCSHLSCVFLLLLVCNNAMKVWGSITCKNSTSVSITMTWDAVPETDLYYVAFSATSDERPFAIKTTDTTSITALDLKPNQTYYVMLRSHPSSEKTIAWAPGWRDFSTPVVCHTLPTDPNTPYDLARVGKAPKPHSIRFSWRTFHNIELLKNSTPKFEVTVASVHRAQENTLPWFGSSLWKVYPLELEDILGLEDMGNNVTFVSSLSGLPQNMAHFLRIREVSKTTSWSDPVMFRTSNPELMYTTTYRISEYAMDVDFLENHNSATAESMPLYLMTCSPEGNCQPWNKTEFMKSDEDWDTCEAYLEKLCPMRGTGFNGCMQCVDKSKEDVMKICGNYTDQDKEHPGFPVHYYCGIGWPENLMYFSAITEYCVEHLPAPNSDPRWKGFAQYISCNSDEVDAAYNNSANYPTCICWVWDDRQMSLLPKSELDSQCSGHFPWFVHEPICNCSSNKTFPGSVAITPDNPSYRYVGAMPVFLPYGYYQQPQESYPARVPSGDNLSTPREGSCNETQQPGDGDCTWKRNAAARVIYGPDLFESGWDDRFIPDTETNYTHHLKNIAVFAKALRRKDDYMTERCCGC